MKRPALLVSLPVVVCIALMAAMPVAAFDLAPSAITVEGGLTEDRVDAERYGANLRWDLPTQWLQVGDWHLVSLVEFGINVWDGSKGRTGEDSLVDFGLTPVLRYQMDPKRGFAPFVEAGVGLHLHTENALNDKDFDIPFAFGSHVGLGARFGQNGVYELMYRYQHQSNAGLGDSNPGINFHVMSVGMHF
jgi:lipid A 3-O-deacylase